MFNEGGRNQDIISLISQGRPVTVNPGRLSSVKSDVNQVSASPEEYSKYLEFKKSFDLKTGLNPYLDEGLIRSREAMKLAVSTFNNPAIHFRTETFSVLSIIAWTYLILEYAKREGLPTTRQNGHAISLADFLKLEGCPFSDGVVRNLKAVIKIRDAVEHTVLGSDEPGWAGIFQACCMNYESALTSLFRPDLSLAREMSFSLQFSGLSIGQATVMGKSNLPEKIRSVNAEIFEGMTEAEKSDLEFQFSVIYMTVASSKSKSAFQFVSPSSAEGVDISNVLVKHKPSANTHPYKPSDVMARVEEKAEIKISQYVHTNMWKKFKVRPGGNSEKPTDTDLKYCYYNPTFQSYTYNEAWVDLICGEITE